MKDNFKRKLSEIRFVYGLLGRLKRRFWACVWLFVFESAWEVVMFTAIATFLQSMINPAGSGGSVFAGSAYLSYVYKIFEQIPLENRQVVGFVIAASSTLLKSFIDIGIEIYRSKFSTLFIWQIRQDTFRRLAQCSMSYFDNNKKGILLQMVINETRSCYSLLKSVLDLIIFSFMCFVYFGMIFLVSWKLSLTVVVISMIFVGENYFMGKIVKKLSAISALKNRVMTMIAEEGVGGIKQVKLLEYYKRLYDDFSRACWDADFSARKSGLLVAWQNSIGYLLGLGTVFFLIYVSLKNSILSVTALLMFLYLIQNLLSKLTALSQKYGFLNQTFPAVENVRRFFDEAEDNMEPTGKIVKDKLLSDKISFRNVTLSYGKDDILKDVSFDVLKGAKVALVGESGAGKTSLVNLLPALYHVRQGNIFIDGVDVREYELGFLRSRLAVINQDIAIFNRTIKENILMAKRDATDEQVIDAAKKAFAHEFIMALPEKYDTIVGDRGVKLSGGQRQRVNIAQAFLREAEILIMDEATSALDTKSERYIQQAIDQLEQHKTTIIIAHRLSTVKNVDMIIVLDKGKIVETGTWDFLVNKNGAFSNMLKQQSFDKVNSPVLEGRQGLNA